MNQTTVFRSLENWSLDMCFVVRDYFRDSTATSKDIVIVALDDKWNREFKKPKMHISPELAYVVEYAKKQRASVVGIDIMIESPNWEQADLARGSLTGDGTKLGELVAAQVKEKVTENNQPRFSIVLPQQFTVDDQTNDRHLVFPIPQWLNKDHILELSDSEYLVSDLPWTSLGFVNSKLDEDSALRRQELSYPINLPGLNKERAEHREPAFAMAIVAAKLGLQEEFLYLLDSSNQTLVRSPDQRGILINYYGAKGYFKHISMMDVLEDFEKTKSGQSPTFDLQNKVVLIGETYATSPDRFVTPYNNRSLASLVLNKSSSLMPGVETHAHAIQTILDQKFITTPWFLSTPLLLILWGALLGSVLISTSLERGFAITFLHHFLWKAICIALFIAFDWRVEMMAVLSLAVLIYATAFAFRWRWIRRMMGMVKSEEVVQALIEDPAKLNLRGEERELTILFSDIRNFTTYSEKHSAAEVVKLLNEYFAIVVPVIEKHGGVVNQYMGDGIMVLFNAPRFQKSHAEQAIRSAIEMVAKVHEHQQRWEKLGAPDLRIGVGIHTGPCVVGTVGSPNRLDYTAIGDTTNTSARIEAGNKELGTEILASAASVAQIPPSTEDLLCLVGPVKTLSVKGKTDQVHVHEIFLPKQV